MDSIEYLRTLTPKNSPQKYIVKEPAVLQSDTGTMGTEEEEEELDKETVGRKAAENLSAEKLHEYRDIFSYFDREGVGSIGSEDLNQVMKSFGWSPKDEELKDMVNVIDQDGNGDISFNEFVWLMTKEFKDSDIEDEVREAFRVFDKEGNGFITTPDLLEVMQSIGDVLSVEEAKEMIEEADVDGDGNVNYEEFVGMIYKLNFGTIQPETEDDNMTLKTIADGHTDDKPYYSSL